MNRKERFFISEICISDVSWVLLCCLTFVCFAISCAPFFVYCSRMSQLSVCIIFNPLRSAWKNSPVTSWSPLFCLHVPLRRISPLRRKRSPLPPAARVSLSGDRRWLSLNLLIFLKLKSHINTPVIYFQTDEAEERNEEEGQRGECTRSHYLCVFNTLTHSLLHLCVSHLLGLGSAESDRSDASQMKRPSAEAPTCTYEGKNGIFFIRLKTFSCFQKSLCKYLKFTLPVLCSPPAAPQSSPLSVDPHDTKEETHQSESNAFNRGFYVDRSPPSARAPPPCGDTAAAESEQDLDVLCQTNTPMWACFTSDCKIISLSHAALKTSCIFRDVVEGSCNRQFLL